MFRISKCDFANKHSFNWNQPNTRWKPKHLSSSLSHLKDLGMIAIAIAMDYFLVEHIKCQRLRTLISSEARKCQCPKFLLSEICAVRNFLPQKISAEHSHCLKTPCSRNALHWKEKWQISRFLSSLQSFSWISHIGIRSWQYAKSGPQDLGLRRCTFSSNNKQNRSFYEQSRHILSLLSAFLEFNFVTVGISKKSSISVDLALEAYW